MYFRRSQSFTKMSCPTEWSIMHLLSAPAVYQLTTIILKLRMMFMVLLSWWQIHCKSSSGLSNECRIVPSSSLRPSQLIWTVNPPAGCMTLRPSQPTWAVSPPLGCYWLHPPSPFSIAWLKSRYSFYHPTKGRRLSWPRHYSKGVQPMSKVIFTIVTRLPMVGFDREMSQSRMLLLDRCKRDF